MNQSGDVPPAGGAVPAGGSSESKLPLDEPLAVVRYGEMGYVGVFRHSLDVPPCRGQHVIIRTERGVELGQVVSAVCKDFEPGTLGRITPERFGELMNSGGLTCVYARQNRLLRLAGPQDINDQIHLDLASKEKMAFCKQEAAELALKMRLVTVEHLFGGERVIFYFTSESRVDFRELVRRLASQYRTRIEMRQIGARDEARLVGDYERCGQRCCCQQFIATLQPVSIRMAKTQKATLDPSKISGRCGRLMCCLRFEDETYEQLRRNLPRKNIWVRTEDLVGRVVDTQILSQLVKLMDVQGATSVVDNDAIIERDVPAPEAPKEGASRRRRVERVQAQPAGAPEARRPSGPPAAGQADAVLASEIDASAPAEEPAHGGGGKEPAKAEADKPPGRSAGRRRRRRKKPAAKTTGNAMDAKGGATPKSNKSKRRNRRRKGPNTDKGAAGPPPAN